MFLVVPIFKQNTSLEFSMKLKLKKKKIFHTVSTTVLILYTDTGIDRHQHSFDSNAILCIYSSASI